MAVIAACKAKAHLCLEYLVNVSHEITDSKNSVGFVRLIVSY